MDSFPKGNSLKDTQNIGSLTWGGGGLGETHSRIYPKEIITHWAGKEGSEDTQSQEIFLGGIPIPRGQFLIIVPLL